MDPTRRVLGQDWAHTPTVRMSGKGPAVAAWGTHEQLVNLQRHAQVWVTGARGAWLACMHAWWGWSTGQATVGRAC